MILLVFFVRMIIICRNTIFTLNHPFWVIFHTFSLVLYFSLALCIALCLSNSGLISAQFDSLSLLWILSVSLHQNLSWSDRMTNELPYTSRKKYPSEGGAARSKWPFRFMEVGDFISIPDRSNHSTASACSKYAANRYTMKFQRRTVSGIMHIKRVS
jgi:hypothetical protein